MMTAKKGQAMGNGRTGIVGMKFQMQIYKAMF